VRVHFPGRGMYRQAVKATVSSSFQMVLASGFPQEHVQRTLHPARKAQMCADVDIHCVASGGAASTGVTPARSMATARVKRTR
jgi:hypothetical protein